MQAVRGYIHIYIYTYLFTRCRAIWGGYIDPYWIAAAPNGIAIGPYWELTNLLYALAFLRSFWSPIGFIREFETPTTVPTMIANTLYLSPSLKKACCFSKPKQKEPAANPFSHKQEVRHQSI